MKKVVFAIRPNNKRFSTRCTKNLRDVLGGDVILYSEKTPLDTTLLVHWGFKATPALSSAIAAGIPFVILDRGYFEPNRVDRVSISFNGHHGLSMPVDVLDRPPRPAPQYHEWRSDGEYVLVCGQVEDDASLRGIDVDAWMNRVAGAAIDALGMPVIKRPHPKQLQPWERGTLPSWDKALAGAAVCVTYSSTMGVQAVLAGVPTVAMHKASPAYSMASPSLAIRKPAGRAAWVHTLSWREYDLTDGADTAVAAQYIRDAYPAVAKAAAAGEFDTEGL